MKLFRPKQLQFFLLINVQFVGVLFLAGTRLGLDLRLDFTFFLDLFSPLTFWLLLFIILVGVITSAARIRKSRGLREG